TTTPGLPTGLVDVILENDESRALAATSRAPGVFAYPASKLALARWVRHHAPQPDWIGAGIRLNAVAPGVIETPMTKDDLEFIFSIPDTFPVPIGRPGLPAELASLLAPMPEVSPVFPEYDIELQAKCMNLVRTRTDVPAPDVRWVELDPQWLGTPFLVMRRIDGEAPPDIPPYVFGGWVADAPSETRA